MSTKLRPIPALEAERKPLSRFRPDRFAVVSATLPYLRKSSGSISLARDCSLRESGALPSERLAPAMIDEGQREPLVSPVWAEIY